MRAFTVHIPNQCVSGPYLSLYGLEGTADVRVAGYWQILTDTYDIHRYEQICVGKNLLKSVKSVKVIFTDTYRYVRN